MTDFTLLTEQLATDRFRRKVAILRSLLEGDDIELGITTNQAGDIVRFDVRHVPTGAGVKACVQSEWRFPDRLVPRRLRSPLVEMKGYAFQVKSALDQEIQDEQCRMKLRAMRSLAQALFAG